MTIHRRRGGPYWYYWVLIVGGIVLVIAWLATGGFGLGADY